MRCLQRCDDLGKRPFGYRLTDRRLQTFRALSLPAHSLEELFEH